MIINIIISILFFKKNNVNQKRTSYKKQNSDKCFVLEYEYPSFDSSFAIAKIQGRYPKKGKFQIKKRDLYYFKEYYMRDVVI